MVDGDLESGGSVEKVGQEQIHGLLFGDKISWQAIIYDLINTEQLDPWDVDLSLLAQRYLDKVRELEDANFFVSSKVLLAAALLLRLKSEIILSRDLPGLDKILFGQKDEAVKSSQERLELEDDVPELVPRTPLPRFRKVSLQELMNSLGKAIQTESRRIKRIVVAKQYEMEASIVLPKGRVNVRDEIRRVYRKLRGLFSGREEKLAFSEFSGKGRDVRVGDFVPLLHLNTQDKVVLEQESHLGEIYIWTKDLFERKNKALLEVMRKEVELAVEAEMSEEKVGEKTEAS